jgi:hypothetical protein
MDKVIEKKTVSVCYTPPSKLYSVDFKKVQEKKTVSVCYTPPSKLYSVDFKKVQEKKTVSVCYTPPSKLYSVDFSQFYSSCGNANLRRVIARSTVATARNTHRLQQLNTLYLAHVA